MAQPPPAPQPGAPSTRVPPAAPGAGEPPRHRRCLGSAAAAAPLGAAEGPARALIRFQQTWSPNALKIVVLRRNPAAAPAGGRRTKPGSSRRPPGPPSPTEGYPWVSPRPPAPSPLSRALTQPVLAHRGTTGRDGGCGTVSPVRPPRASSGSTGASPRRCGGGGGEDGAWSGARRRSAGRDSPPSLLPPYLTARADLTADGERGNRSPSPRCRSRTAGPRRVTLAARQRRFKVGYLRWLDETRGGREREGKKKEKTRLFYISGPRQLPPLPLLLLRRSREPAETQTAILGDGERGPRQPPVPAAGDTFTAVPPACPNVTPRAAAPGAVTPTGVGRGPSRAFGAGDARGTPSKRLSRDKCRSVLLLLLSL